jgi:YhcH/YjgK/YiaL family protein
MIIDKLTNRSLYRIENNGISLALEYLASADLDNTADGRYAIDGDNIFALISTYETKDREGSYLEAHRKHIDVQYVASGSELLGYLSAAGQKIYKEYDGEKDIMFYNEEPSFLEFQKGTFVVLFPNDLHMPGIKNGQSCRVKKVVVKVKM